MTTPLKPTREEFRALAREANLIPVFTELIADCETPVSAFQKLDAGGYSFLLESAETSDQVGRYSFVGADPKMIFESNGRNVRITGPGGKVRELEGDPLAELQKLMAQFRPSPGQLPPLHRRRGRLPGLRCCPVLRADDPPAAEG